MTLSEIIPIACSVVSCACAVFVSIRAGNWRDTDDARALDKRISAIEGRVQVCETRTADLPTKADVERLRGEVHTASELTRSALDGVRRIETFMMQGTVRS